MDPTYNAFEGFSMCSLKYRISLQPWFSPSIGYTLERQSLSLTHCRGYCVKKELLQAMYNSHKRTQV